MKKAALTIGLFLVGFQAIAADCPCKLVTKTISIKWAAQLKPAKAARTAPPLLKPVRWGASGDGAITPVAERKCGLDFWNKLTASDKKIYNGLQAKCDAKYKDMQGTMYISAAAFCRLRVARLFSDLYSPAE